MKVGDLVRPTSDGWLDPEAIGVVINSRVMVSTEDLSEEIQLRRAANLNSHQVYWGSPVCKAIWVKQKDLQRVF